MDRFASEWILTPFALAIHAPTRTAVLADPHLGYNDARRRSGDAVPCVAVEDDLVGLRQACAAFEIENLVVAGDLCEARLTDDLVDQFVICVERLGLRLAGVVPGNHDRGWRDQKDKLPICSEGYRLGTWTVIHGDRKAPEGAVVMGHVHPAWRTAAGVVPCYLIRPDRLILPAFSRDAAGGAVNHSPRWTGFHAIAIEDGRLIDRGVLPAPRSPRRRNLRGFLEGA